MTEYRVCWCIDVTAPTPILAALIAERMQRSQIFGHGGEFVVVDNEGQTEDVVDLEKLLIPPEARIAMAAEFERTTPRESRSDES